MYYVAFGRHKHCLKSFESKTSPKNLTISTDYILISRKTQIDFPIKKHITDINLRKRKRNHGPVRVYSRESQ